MRHAIQQCLALSLASAAILPPGRAHAAPAYVVTTLPLVEAFYYSPHTLNRWGQVVLDRDHNPTLWSPAVANGTTGTFLTLSDLPGYPPHPPGQTTGLGYATAINDRGQIVGTATTTRPPGDSNGAVSWLYTPTPLNSPTGVLATSGSLTAFPLLTTNGQRASQSLTDIDNAGRAIGSGAYFYPWLFIPTTPNSATGLWRGSRYAQVNPALLNDSGTYVVFARSPHTGALRTRLLPNGTNGGFITSPQWVDSNQAQPVDVSDSGLVLIQAPAAGAAGAIHTYIVNGTLVTDITPGPDSSFGVAINNSSMVVGKSVEPWVYTILAARPLSTLVSEDVTHLNPVAINDAGQILARNEGSLEAKLLTPAALVTADRATASAATPIPVTGGFDVQITVTNRTSAPLPGPVSVALDGIAARRFPNRAGVTAYAGPAGSALATVTTGDIAGNASASVTVRITGAAVPAVAPRVLAGPAPR